MSAARNTISPSTRGQNQTAVGAAPRADRQIVTFGEVARECRETARGAVGAKIVGLEHLDPEDLELKRFDEGGDNTFTKSFKKGQMLFGRRRAYLKKAALAPFDGICSGDITVIEAIPEKLDPELLPFLVQNDAFFAYAVGGSAGSLSPRVKWEHLAAYAFSLPPLAEQKKLASALWAMERVKRAYKKLLAETDRLVEARFVEMFGDQRNTPRRAIKDVCQLIDYRGKTPKKSDAGIPLITAKNVREWGFSLEPREWMDAGEYDNWMVRGVPVSGDVMFTTEAPLGNVCIIPEFSCRFAVGQRIITLHPDSSILDAVYLERALRSHDFQKSVLGKSTGTTVFGIKGRLFAQLSIPLPPLSLQREFAAFVGRAEKAKESLKGALKALTAAQKAKMNAAFRG